MEGGSDITKLGPFGIGGHDGKAWDGKGHSDIVQIFISHHHDSIDSFQYQYADENGKLLLSKLHGQICASNFDVVTLNYPHEYITLIKGNTGSSFPSIGLRSITFGTNLGVYGPFGGLPDTQTRDYKFSVNLGKKPQFFGFHGIASSNCVRSIGVYMKPNTTLDLQVVKKES